MNFDQLVQALRSLQSTLDIGARISRVAADAGAAVAHAWTSLVVTTENVRGGPFTSDIVIATYAPQVRNLADAALVPIAMWAFYRVMFGHGMFTQYTARIMLPRILVAAGGINFSLPVIQGAIDLDNALCKQVLALLGEHTSFVTMVASWTRDVSPEPGLGPVVTLLLLAAFVVLGVIYVVRYALLVMLAILAPLAAVLMVLPDTQHYAKEWLSLFVSTVFMQPLQLFVLSIGLCMESNEPSIIRHGFALAAVWMCFKVPGALHSASTMGGHAQTLARHQADRLLKVARAAAAHGVAAAA